MRTSPGQRRGGLLAVAAPRGLGAGIGMVELTRLEVDGDQAAQAPMNEQEVDPEPAVADTQVALALHHEATAELKPE